MCLNIRLNEVLGTYMDDNSLNFTFMLTAFVTLANCETYFLMVMYRNSLK